MKRYKVVVVSLALLLVFGVGYVGLHPLRQAMQVTTQQMLAGKVIVIDAGHGGKDNGAYEGGYKEDELNLAVATALKAIVEQAGGTVVMIRNDDRDLADMASKIRKREDLKRRVEIMDHASVDLFVSIHMNIYFSPNAVGGQVFYRSDDAASKKLAGHIQKMFVDQLESKKKIKIGNFFILNESSNPGVLIECGFMSNPLELSKLINADYQMNLAYAIYQGIVEYFLDILSPVLL